MNLLKKIRYNKYFFPCASYFRQLLISIYGNDHKCGYEKWVLFVLKMIVSPFIIPCYLLYGLFMFKRQLRWDRKSTFEYQLTMVAIVKNEASYLQEWVEYYRLIGVGKAKQVEAYSDAINRLKYKTRYVMFMDIDEFLVLKNPEDKLLDYVDSILYRNKAAGLAISWLMFGSSGHIHRPEGLVIENYIYRAHSDFMRNVKTIGNPRIMHSCVNPHYPIYKYGRTNINENGRCVVASMDFNKSVESIWINHYFTKSADECMAKISKGIATVGQPRTITIFKERDKNDELDETIMRYAEDLKSRLVDYKRTV